MTKRSAAALFTWILVVGFVIATCFHYIQGTYFHKPYPYNTFLFWPAFPFSDFIDMVPVSKNLNPYFESDARFQSSYFPFANLIFFGASKIRNALGFFLLISIVGHLYVGRKFLKNLGLSFRDTPLMLLTPLLSYPFLFGVDRGNLDLWISLLVFYAIANWRKRPGISVVCIALGAACKFYPLVFVVLFVRSKNWKAIAATMVLSAFFLVLPLFLFQGGVVANFNRLFFSNLSLIGGTAPYFSNQPILQTGISFFHMIKATLFLTGALPLVPMPMLSMVYSVFVMVMVAGFGLCSISKKTSDFHAAILLVTMVVALPFVSCDYRAMLFFGPIAILFSEVEKMKLAPFWIVTFGLILIPNQYFIIDGLTSEINFQDLSFSVMTQPFLFLVVLGMVFYEVYRDHVGGRKSTIHAGLSR